MPDINKYLPWYRIAESVLGGLVPAGRTDREVMEMISPNDWLIIPTHTESSRHQSIVRPDPNIYFSVRQEIELGLVCNTLRSILKMRNILLQYHSKDEEKFIGQLHRLDDTFETTVGKKRYPYHPRQSPLYTEVFSHRSNMMNESVFEKTFSLAQGVYEEGREEQSKLGIKWNPIRPTVGLTECSLPHNRDLFEEKLRAIVPLYELCLSIKTETEIRREARRSGMIERLRCPSCKYGPIPAQITRFCPECKTKMIPV